MGVRGNRGGGTDCVGLCRKRKQGREGGSYGRMFFA